ncbi:MAG: radical SAM family heme chaperone HemW [Rhodothermales bacterium]
MAGLYLHIPFCTQRCVYCDFYFVTTAKSPTPFVTALLKEIEHYGTHYGSREPIDTIYFGGGTPSLLPASDLYRILNALYDHFEIADDAEVTLELNPEDVALDDLRALRNLGITRLSIGIQSFFADDLAFMNRSHTPEQAEAIVPLAQQAGFDNLTIDLIFGLPDQPFEYWAANLQKATRLDVPHLSTYGLTLEERTPLYNQVQRGLVTPTDETTMNERYLFTMDYLTAQGYEAYEISSFAQPGYRSRHNQSYWTHTNYLGFGPSAHSFWWQRGLGSRAERWSNVRNLKQYEALLGQRHLPLDTRDRLSLNDLGDEHILLRLRTTDGLDLGLLEQTYGIDLLDAKMDELAWLEADGLIEPIRNRRVRLTPNGRLVADAVVNRLLLDSKV